MKFFNNYILIITFLICILILPMTIDGKYIDIRVGKHLIEQVLIGGILLCLLPVWSLRGFYAVILYHTITRYSLSSQESFWWLTGGLGLYCAVYYLFHNKRELSNVLCLTHIFVCLFLLSQHLGICPLPIINTDAPAATFSNPNVLGSFLAITGAFFFRRKWWWYVPVTCLCLYLANSTTPMIAYYIGLVVWTSRRFNRYSILLGFMLVGIVLYTDLDVKQLIAKQGVRYNLWRDTIKMQFINGQTTTYDVPIGNGKAINVGIYSRPYRGYGLGNFENIAAVHHIGWDSHRGQRHAQAHNDYLEIIFELGLIGFFPLLLYLLHIWSKCIKKRDVYSIAVIVLSVNCLGHFVFQTPVSFIAIVILAIASQTHRVPLLNQVEIS